MIGSCKKCSAVFNEESAMKLMLYDNTFVKQVCPLCLGDIKFESNNWSIEAPTTPGAYWTKNAFGDKDLVYAYFENITIAKGENDSPPTMPSRELVFETFFRDIPHLVSEQKNLMWSKRLEPPE